MNVNFSSRPSNSALLSLAIAIFLLTPGFGQTASNIPGYEPVQFKKNDLSTTAGKILDRRDELLKKEKLSEKEQTELSALLAIYNESVESIWDVIKSGCSWYCGGGNYLVRASSQLTPSGAISYAASSANDLSYQTVWVEGKPDDGRGEYLEFLFKNESPRITSVIISNGYIKSEKTWHENNRVKTLTLYVNGSAYATLLLADTPDDQIFKVGTLGRNPDGSDLVLKFEIADVYPGTVYNDTAITEIYFDGIDVH